MKKKKHNNTPRRKRLSKKQWLSIAKSWIKIYTGKNIVKGYSNWFGVDLLCAIAELRIIGQNISHEYESQVRKSIEDKILKRKIAKEKRELVEFDNKNDFYWDSEFDFIAGYTSNGFPYGIKKDDIV